MTALRYTLRVNFDWYPRCVIASLTKHDRYRGSLPQAQWGPVCPAEQLWAGTYLQIWDSLSCPTLEAWLFTEPIRSFAIRPGSRHSLFHPSIDDSFRSSVYQTRFLRLMNLMLTLTSKDRVGPASSRSNEGFVNREPNPVASYCGVKMHQKASPPSRTDQRA